MNWIVLSSFIGCTEEDTKQATSTDSSVTTETITEPSNEPETEPCDAEIWYEDKDGDEFGNPFVAVESCTPMDGYVQNNSDCNDDDPAELPGQVWYLDIDGDGFGNPDVSIEQCYRPTGHVLNNEDCNDQDSTINPVSVWYEDADADGFGNPNVEVESCAAAEGNLPHAGDCNDEDPEIHPDSPEVCDYIDNDCDELIDNDDPNLDEYTEVLIYEDLDEDGVGTNYILMACPSAGLGSTISGDCDDSDPDIYPGNFEWPDDTDQNCDGVSYWHMSDDIQKGVYDAESRQNFGSRFYTGDYNDDGVWDLFISSPSDNNNTGKVFWVDGTSDLNFSDVGDGVQVWTGTTEDEEFGRSAGVVGDLSEDGLSDVLISSSNGVVYLFNTSSASGTTEDAIWHWQLPESPQSFGGAILPLGDIDADGFEEALVGATAYRDGDNKRGAVFLLDNDQVGSTHNPADGNFIIGTEPGFSPNFGETLALVKDANGDGVNEVLVSAPLAAGYSTGRVFMYQVSDLLDPATLGSDGIMFMGEMYGQKVGLRLYGIDDFNGDGYADFMISAEKLYNSTTEFGKIYIVYGKSDLAHTNLADADVQLVNDGSLGGFASKMLSPGDMNADGLSDIVFSSYDYTGIPHSGPGIVFGLFGGNLSGIYEPIATADFAISGYGYYREFGSGIAPAGDIDADGFDDFWVGQIRTAEILLFTGDNLQ